ncbi:Tex family protein [Gallicola sp. Sow4_E12]|uniref:Tex family protein n=1 Tax=Gallicola sp. Sow4_E12 TaxID=3438785 RepID=UPI003F927E2C
MNIEKIIAEKLKISENQVQKTVELIDEGNTIPFISRYRKEVTGNLTDTVLRDLEENLTYLRNLQKRKEDVLRIIEEQGKLTEELKAEIEKAEKLQEVEDLYLPFKQKKRTRASQAKERGLEPLKEYLFNFEDKTRKIEEEAEKYITEEVPTVKAALQGAMDILAEEISETKEYRDIVRAGAKKGGLLCEGDPSKDDGTYEMYYEFAERMRFLKPHRILAIFRGEKEGILKLKFDFNDADNMFQILKSICLDKEDPGMEYLQATVIDSYKRLLRPSIETEVKNELKEMADKSSIEIFGDNLRPYLMQPPIKDMNIIGLDPGYRTGCKTAVVSSFGEVLDYGVIYPAKPKADVEGSKKTLKKYIEKYDINLIAIGNGTASRETEQMVVELLSEVGKKDLYYAIVNEAGASIYSASKLGNDEFPDLDVTIRGAISIARRIQDPLAELVKIEPQHIGVGQYQHDVNQKELSETLEKIVEDCVNSVGVDINTASVALLGYVSGITKTTAKNILEYKRENGPFSSRKEIKKVKGIGPKAFTQCAGFLRIPESKEVLDHTAVHPESYDIAVKLLDRDLDKIDYQKTAEELEVGIPTLQDIVAELKKPGRDPRDEMPKPILRSDVLSIEDLEVGMELQGTVRNVVAFGAFVDIGIKNDGLVHISQLSDRFIKDPKEVVKVSDIVNVKIIDIDVERGKVGLSMKGLKRKKRK